MKNAILQYTNQAVVDSKGFIEGNVAEYLILSTQSENFEYRFYLSDEEYDEYEKASNERRQEIRDEVDNWIRENFNFNISEWNY